MKEKDILCAIDSSESSQAALTWAFDLAGMKKAAVTVLFCYRLVAAMHDDETLRRKRAIENEAMTKFRRFEEEHRAAKSVPHKFIFEAGFPHFQIEMFLEKHPTGLLVLGSSVIQHFDEFKALGFSTFLRQTNIPVVLVP